MVTENGKYIKSKLRKNLQKICRKYEQRVLAGEFYDKNGDFDYQKVDKAKEKYLNDFLKLINFWEIDWGFGGYDNECFTDMVNYLTQLTQFFIEMIGYGTQEPEFEHYFEKICKVIGAY